MVVGDKSFRTLNTLANRPTLVSTVHIINEHLQVFARCRRKRKFQPAVHRVTELPYLGFGFGRLEHHRVLKVTAVLHLQVLGAFERITLSLKFAVRPNGYLNVFCEGEMQGQIMVSHNTPVAEAVIVYCYRQNLCSAAIVYNHCRFVSSYFIQKCRFCGVLRFGGYLLGLKHEIPENSPKITLRLM